MSKSGLTPFRQRDGDEFLALHLLPWDTDAILSELVPKEMQKELGKLECALLERERNMKSHLMHDPNNSRLNISAIRYLLANGPQNADVSPAASHFTAFMQQLCVYRVFDVANQLAKKPRSVALHGQQKFNVGKGFYKHMNDWTTHIRRLVNNLDQLSIAASTLAVRPKNAGTPEAFSWNMLKAISKAAQVEDISILKSNILVAAFSLRYLLEGNLDLPHDMAQIYDSLSKATALDIPAEWPRGAEKTQQMRLPLQLALSVSPLCLLIPTCLSKKDVSREDLVIAWQCIGNTRPLIIMQAEDRLWQLIFCIAREEVNFESELTYTMHELASLVNNMREDEKTWFMRDNNQKRSYSFANRPFNLISCPEDWPSRDHLLGIKGGLPNLLKSNQGESEPDEEADEAPLVQSVTNGEGVSIDTNTQISDDQSQQSALSLDSNAQTHENQNRRSAPLLRSAKGGPKKLLNSTTTPYHLRSKSSLARRTFKRASKPGCVATTLKQKRGEQKNGKDEDDGHLEDIETIDLTREWLIPEHTLQLTSNYSEPSVLSREYTMFATLGHTKSYESPLPHAIDQKFLNDVVELAQASYVDGVPLHWKENGNSVFFIIDHSTFEGLSPQKLQEIFRQQHIIVTDIPQKGKIEFNRRGLETLGAWKKLRTLQDLTTPVEDGNYASRLCQGSLEDLAQHASSKNGRVINVLDLPLLHAEAPDPRLASDMRAWSDTIALPLWSKMVEFPTHQMRWGLAATRGAQHLWYVGAGGVATAMEVKTGSKWWFVARPKEGTKNILNLVDVDVKNWTYDPAAPNADLWDSEAILLLPGMKLIMKPNTPHMVVTPEHTICHGSHFISTATLRATCYGVIGSFVQQDIHTNAENCQVWYSLLRLLLFYREVYLDSYLDDPELDKTHIPDCETAEGVLDLFMFLAVMELGLALFPGSYDPKGISARDWARFNQGKNAVSDIVCWFNNNFETRRQTPRQTEEVIAGIYGDVLLHQSMFLIMCKEKSTKDRYGEEKVPACESTSAVLYEVAEVLAKHHEIGDMDARLLLRSGFFDDIDGYIGTFTPHRRVQTNTCNANPLHRIPDLDTARFHKIKAMIKAGEWPVPRITVEEFIGWANLKQFPYDNLDESEHESEEEKDEEDEEERSEEDEEEQDAEEYQEED